MLSKHCPCCGRTKHRSFFLHRGRYRTTCQDCYVQRPDGLILLTASFAAGLASMIEQIGKMRDGQDGV